MVILTRNVVTCGYKIKQPQQNNFFYIVSSYDLNSVTFEKEVVNKMSFSKNSFEWALVVHFRIQVLTS